MDNLNLGWHECETLARFLLHHMTMETRLRLMAEMPVTYSRLHPHVQPSTLLAEVAAAIGGNHPS